MGASVGDRPRLEPGLARDATAVFGLLASTTRLHLVWLLAHGDADVRALTEALGVAAPAVSQHLAKLKLAGLVTARREGRRHIYRIADPRVAAMLRAAVDALGSPAGEGRAPGGRLPPFLSG